MAALTERGLSLEDLVPTELVRGLATPFGHGLWTAILGGVLFSRSGRDSFGLTGRLLAAYLGVSILHALWDSVHGFAGLITVALTEPSRWSAAETPGWINDPSPEQVAVLTVVTWGGLTVVGLIGVAWWFALLSVYGRPRRAKVRGYTISTSGRWWPGGRPPRR